MNTECEHSRVVRNAIAEDRRVILLGYCLGCEREVDVDLADYARTKETEFGRPIYQITRPLQEQAAN
ncbi:MAG: hypothetical protein AABX14_01900 [Candidatus Aenigmatarchaeota archaeon]